MDSAVISNGQPSSDAFKQEDNLMSRLKEILIHQEMIEKRLKEGRMITNNDSDGSESKVTSFVKEKESENTSTKVPTVVVDTASDNGQSVDSDDQDISSDNQHQQQSNESTANVQSHENITSDCTEVEKIIPNIKPESSDEPSELESDSNKKLIVKSDDDDNAKQSAVVATANDPQNNNHNNETNHNSTAQEIPVLTTVKLNANQATDNTTDNGVEINANVSEDQVDRVVVSEIRKMTLVQQTVSFEEKNELNDQLEEELICNGAVRDDSAFGDSVESISGEMDNSIASGPLCGSESSGRTVSTAASPEPYTLHDENNNDLLEPPPEIELIIRASTIDRRRKGSCLFCHEYFISLYILAQSQLIKLKVTTVDMLRPPKNFRSNFDSTPPPILIDRRQAILENEKIERYIMKNIPGGHNLFISDKETATVIENLYSKFKLALARDEPHTKNNLLRQLEAIDEHLRRRDSRFLTGPHICCFDCELMARLQHIRVAGPYFLSDFEIPPRLDRLWRYMANMYELAAFVESCPADQDIISHYLTDSGLRQRASVAKRVADLQLQTPTYATSVPSQSPL